jgi:hypothetical protein
MKMRPIDADALVEKSWDAETRVGYVQVVDVGSIEEAPTLDAVPVVRCKDCIFSATFRSGNMYCKLHENYTFFTKPDGYCSHGAKMDLEE